MAPAGSAYATEPPGASGDIAWPNYVGPSGNGLVERMNAGRKPGGIKGVREWAPLSVSGSAVSGSKENAAVGRREARRHALWAGNPVSQTGEAMPQGRPMGAAIRAREFRRSASLFWECEGFE